MSKAHRCPECGWKHSVPKASRPLKVIAYAVIFGVFEVLAALQLDGWLAIPLWVIAARNALLFIWTVVALANLAVHNATAEDES